MKLCRGAFGVSRWTRRRLAEAGEGMGKTYHCDVDEAEDDHDDSRRYHYAPEGEPERLFTRCLFVQVSENADAQYDHRHAECDEAGRRAQKWPVADEVGAEKWELRYDQEDFGRGRTSVADI